MVTDRKEPALWVYSIPDDTLIEKLVDFLMAPYGRPCQLPESPDRGQTGRA
jgi:hypothetical protein